jgi:CBS domain containing-hemolysin-like protein
LIQKANLIPESAPLSDLLILLQGSRRKMAIVVNEFGEMAGVVTLDDILQEILSSKSKINPTGEFILEKIDQNTYILDSQINLLEFNHLFAVNIAATEEYQTLRGFLLYQWQQIPEVGETISYENLEFEVISAKERRVELVKCSKK